MSYLCLGSSAEVLVPFRLLAVLLCAVFLLAQAGCEKRQHVVPIKGTVLYKDKPLTSGSVMFQPEAGTPATGRIQPDGTFVLSTYDVGDGATVGLNKVRVVSTEQQPENLEIEATVGRSLIPEKYNNFGTSPLTFEVKEPGDENAVLKLED